MNNFIYLDAAASFLKNQSVINAEMDFLTNHYANAGRGVCDRAACVDDLIMQTRNKVANFINAKPEQVVFTSGATDGLNRVVYIVENILADKKVSVAVSDIDHHSARMPWEHFVYKNGGKIVLCPLTKDFDIDYHEIPMSDVLVITAMSNVLGRAQNVQEIIKSAREKNPNVITVVDATQYVVHCEIDVKKFDCDFLVFSGHKIGADTGVGILYVKNPDVVYPDKFGGGMIARLNSGVQDWHFEPQPYKFEAGTLPLTQIVGLGVAVDTLVQKRPDLGLVKLAYDELSKIDEVKIFTQSNDAILSFIVSNMKVIDFGVLVGANNICLRVGNMCASWIHNKLGIDGSVRVSVGPWNNEDDIKQLVAVVKNLVKKNDRH